MTRRLSDSHPARRKSTTALGLNIPPFFATNRVGSLEFLAPGRSGNEIAVPSTTSTASLPPVASMPQLRPTASFTEQLEAAHRDWDTSRQRRRQRRKSKMTDDSMLRPPECSVSLEPDELGSLVSDTGNVMLFHASSRRCTICDTAPTSSELITSPCKCSLAWLHPQCLEDFKLASGRNTCPRCNATWFQGFAPVKLRRSYSLKFFTPSSS
ncbi:hypothetical protein SDRG_15552 [Saprolegnia diclina VS20]|uniref:Uncharacterized protein n=1 Tax=Saprolegnia diclina (strain VS20) TaxID=1156394 RepID=T0RAN3_SAPDV|nr:hypothetical protein SDRG_15552 [Saprolegnia diclina VS20]EQC26612.1 hypothetical protein SDRG_15552 [Saprolegnia diclina VS20]|eukprot:XP_008619950.1 hypothetical protein SDRG_15552 [Saprolegnia diclina VS20]